MKSKFELKARKQAEMSNKAEVEEREAFRFAYELLDFGDGRKLERFAGKTLDRPSPAAQRIPRQQREAWKSADFVFRNKPASAWSDEKSPEEWHFCWKSVVMELRLSPYGHVGLFPEQIANWRWLQNLAFTIEPNRSPKALNLFGYTGGSTLAMAEAGFQLTHVDASRPTVHWARRNAQLSGMDSAAIRWIVDDVRDFVKREIKRDERYDVILMDPPAYGHGADGKGWELTRDLEDLVADCLELLTSKPTALLLTGHSPVASIEKGPLSSKSWDQLKTRFGQVSKHRVSLADPTLRKLDFGYAYRFWT